MRPNQDLPEVTLAACGRDQCGSAMDGCGRGRLRVKICFRDDPSATSGSLLKAADLVQRRERSKGATSRHAVQQGTFTDCNVSFDHLAGAQQERLWDCEPECLGGLQIEHRLKQGRLEYRQVGWLGAP
jgi:hypothetical protein